MSLGQSMKWDAAHYDGQHSFVTRYGQGILHLLEPKAGERILDVGCGTGHLTKQIADCGSKVVGLDSSLAMIDVARQHDADIEWVLADFCEYSSPSAFDAIFSNAALHWIQPPEAAAAKMSQLLRPGGRLVAEFGGYGNVLYICRALEEAVRQVTGQTIQANDYFPSISQYSTLLEQNSFEVRLARLFDRPTRLEGEENGLRDWLQLFRRPIMEALKTEEREQVLQLIESQLHSILFRDGAWYADYRRLQIVAYKLG